MQLQLGLRGEDHIQTDKRQKVWAMASAYLSATFSQNISDAFIGCPLSVLKLIETLLILKFTTFTVHVVHWWWWQAVHKMPKVLDLWGWKACLTERVPTLTRPPKLSALLYCYTIFARIFPVSVNAYLLLLWLAMAIYPALFCLILLASARTRKRLSSSQL